MGFLFLAANDNLTHECGHLGVHTPTQTCAGTGTRANCLWVLQMSDTSACILPRICLGCKLDTRKWSSKNQARGKNEYKILRRKQGTKASQHWIWQWFFGYETKAIKNKQIRPHENKNFCASKNTFNSEKTIHRMGENNCKSYIW